VNLHYVNIAINGLFYYEDIVMYFYEVRLINAVGICWPVCSSHPQPSPI